MAEDNDFLNEAEDDLKTIEFIKSFLPQKLKGKFTDDQLYYFLDVISEYYADSGCLDVQPDKDGFIEIDEEKVADYILKQAKKDGMGDFDAEDLLYVVDGEMEYGNSGTTEE